MRKAVINVDTEAKQLGGFGFLDLEALAQVEITSECAEFPIENALLPGFDSGWRAAMPGEQTVRLVFDQPQVVKRIFLVIDEHMELRTQEFVINCRQEGEDGFKELLRQQYHFSPPVTTREVESYSVDFKNLKALEFKFIPDINGSGAFAKISQLRLFAQ